MKLFARILFIFASFGVFSSVLCLIGNPRGPAWAALEHKSERTHDLDFAVIGDSRAHDEISPRILSEHLSSKASGHTLKGYNFGVDGTDVLHHFSFATHALLEAKTKPKMIIWVPNVLQFDEQRSNNRLEELQASDIASLWKAGAPLESMLDVVTQVAFRPWAHRPLIAEIISDYTERAGLRSLAFQSRFMGLRVVPESTGRRYEPQEDGQNPFVVIDWKDRFDRSTAIYANRYQHLHLSERRFQIARMLAHEAAANGVVLVMIESPVAPWFQQNLLETKDHLAWRAQMQKIADDEGALFLNHSRFYDHNEYFGDAGHLDKATSDDYSVKLAKVLAADPRIEKLLSSQN